MRVCLLVHALTPYELTGVENHTAQLAAALARRGLEVQVFAPCPAEGTWRLAQRLEERDGYEIHWLALEERQLDEEGNEPGVREAFGRYLDRERPELVHAQHLIGLGPVLVTEARRRGIPFLFTAHDAWLVSEEYRLLRPDFVALGPSDTDALGRVFLARRLLDRLLPELDHQGLVTPGDLDKEGHALLAEVLDGDPGVAGFGPEEVDGMRRRAEVGRRARLEALRAVDLVLSPTQFLAGVLRGGGVAAPLEVETCGIDLAPFERLARTPRAEGAPLRVAFLGGISKHKGLHELFEAVDGLEGVELSVHGGSSDHAYSERCRARARELGAEWSGPFEGSELPGILAGTDVIVVPSAWPENAPFVIREAFAAGVPVIAADVGAMSESIRHGVDGWLFPAGDTGALRARLRELADSPALLDEVAAGVRPPRSIDDQAASLVERYQSFVLGSVERPSARLEHLEEFTRRFEAVQDTGWRELVESSLEGYRRLCESLSPGRTGGERIVRAIAGGAKLRERLAEGERARAWLGKVVEETRRSGEVSDALAEWQAETEGALSEKTAWLEEQLAARADEIAALLSERDGVQGERDQALLERSGLSKELESMTAEVRWLRDQLEFARGESERMGEERDQRGRDLKELSREVEWLRKELTVRDEAIEEQSTGATEVEVVAAEARWLKGQLEFAESETVRLEGALGERTKDLGKRRRESEWLKAELAERDRRLVHEARKLEDAKRSRAASDEESEHERAQRERSREEVEWREEALAASSEELEEERRRVSSLEEARAHLDKEVSWLRETHEALRDEISFLRGEVDVREEERARWRDRMDSLSSQQERLLEHELWLRGELRRLLDAVTGAPLEDLAPEDVAERVSEAVEVLVVDEPSEEDV